MNTDDKTRQFFARKAAEYYEESYARPRDRHAFNLTLRRDACMSLLPERRGVVLDLGCGPGAMTLPLLQRGETVVAVDLSREMVRETSERAVVWGGAFASAQCSATALPFADGTFAAVVSTGVLEYVPDISLALHEVRRVLQFGGVFVGTMSMPRRVERFASRMLSRARGYAPETTQFIYDRSAFDRLVTGAGLEIVERVSCAFMPFPLDALWPKGLLLLDRFLAGSLNQSNLACDHAKTYIVKANRPAASATA